MKAERKKTWRALKWVAGLLVVVILIFLYGVVPWFFTKLVTSNRYHYHDRNNGRTPLALGMNFQDVQFKSRDGIVLKGWYVPAGAALGGDARGTIIYCHGFHRTRVEMLPMAQFGHELGYNGLLFDFRNHGKSGGKRTSLGYWERWDAEAAVAAALTGEKAPHPVILWGVSMGAAAALMAAAEDPSIDAVISDSTFLSFKGVIKHHYRLVLTLIRRRWWWFPSLPSFPLTDEVIDASAWRDHFSPSQFNLGKAVQRIGQRPILFVAVRGDARMPPEIARTLYGVDTSPLKEIIVLPGKRHGEGFNDATQPYKHAVAEFLEQIRASAGFGENARGGGSLRRTPVEPCETAACSSSWM